MVNATLRQPPPEFVDQIAAALSYWQQAAGSGTHGVAELDRERHNLFRAVHFGLALPQTQVASAEVALHLFPLVESRGYWPEWIPILEKALAVCPADRAWLRFKLLNRLGQLWRLTKQLSRAIAAHEEALLLCRQLDDPLTLAEAHYNLGWAHREAHHYDAAERHALAVLELLPGAGSEFARQLKCRALTTLGRTCRSRGDLAGGLDYLRQAVGLARHCQDAVILADTLHDLGNALVATKQYDEALACYAEAVPILAASGRTLEHLLLQYETGVLHFAQDQWAQAEVAFRQIDLAYLRQTGNLSYQTIVLTALGNAILYQGRYAEAATYLRQAVALWRQMDDELELANAVGSLGEVLAAMGERQEALALFDEALALLAHFPENARAQRLGALFSGEKAKLEAGSGE
jgi:tetratricopeptide (TPR) repeat protein